MATLLINDISEKELAELNALARRDNVPVEQEALRAIRHYANSRKNEVGLIPRENLLAELERFHADLIARGVRPMAGAEIQQYKTEGRE